MRTGLEPPKLLLLGLCAFWIGQGIAWGQATKMPTSFKAIPLFSSKRADLEIEVSPIQGDSSDNGYRIYLLDKSQNRPLPNLQPISARRVYQVEDLKSSSAPLVFLDQNCNLYVATFGEGRTWLKVRRYDPTVVFSPEYRAQDVYESESWQRAMRAIDRDFAAPDRLELFGAGELDKLQVISDDTLIPDKVKEEQRSKLHSGVVALLNKRMLEWRYNLEEVRGASAGPGTVQETWLAMDVREWREGIKAGKRQPTDDYWHKLRLFNRLILRQMLAKYQVYDGFSVATPAVWTTGAPNPEGLDLDPAVASEKCTMEVTARGWLEFRKDGERIPVTIDAATGKLLEPLTSEETRLEDVVARVGASYSGVLRVDRRESPEHKFVLRISSYEAKSGSFTGEMTWDFQTAPNRVSGKYADGELSWREYRVIDGAEVPGGSYMASAKQSVSGFAKLTLITENPDVPPALLQAVGSLDLRPALGQANKASSPYSGKPFPAAREQTVVYPRLPAFVAKLAEVNDFKGERSYLYYADQSHRDFASFKVRFTLSMAKTYPEDELVAYCGGAPKLWVMELDARGQEGERRVHETITWSLDDKALNISYAEGYEQTPVSVPSIPGGITRRFHVVPDRFNHQCLVRVSFTFGSR